VSGLYGCVYNGLRSGFGFIYCSIEGVRPLSRSEARMAEVAMKRAIAARKNLVMREEATVSDRLLMLHGPMWGGCDWWCATINKGIVV
jgi:hypothetical protein